MVFFRRNPSESFLCGRVHNSLSLSKGCVSTRSLFGFLQTIGVVGHVFGSGQTPFLLYPLETTAIVMAQPRHNSQDPPLGEAAAHQQEAYIHLHIYGTTPTTITSRRPPDRWGGIPFRIPRYIPIRSLLPAPVPLVLRNGHDKRVLVTQNNVYAFKLRNVLTTACMYAMVVGDVGFSIEHGNEKFAVLGNLDNMTKIVFHKLHQLSSGMFITVVRQHVLTGPVRVQLGEEARQAWAEIGPVVKECTSLIGNVFPPTHDIVIHQDWYVQRQGLRRDAGRGVVDLWHQEESAFSHVIPYFSLRQEWGLKDTSLTRRWNITRLSRLGVLGHQQDTCQLKFATQNVQCVVPKKGPVFGIGTPTVARASFGIQVGHGVDKVILFQMFRLRNLLFVVNVGKIKVRLRHVQHLDMVGKVGLICSIHVEPSGEHANVFVGRKLG